MTNFQRSYRITIGIPKIKKEAYNQSHTFVVPYLPNTDPSITDATSIPEGDIIQLSNLPQDDASLRGYMFTFESNRTVSASASKTEKSVLGLYNINQEVLSAINQEGCKVVIEAGYNGSVSIVYTGNVETVYTKNQGIDTVTTVRLVDLGNDIKNTKISVDFDESVSVKNTLTSLISLFPTASVGNNAIETLAEKYVFGGASYQGTLSNIVNKVCYQHDVIYSIHNGVITLQDGQMVQGDPSFKIAEKNLWKLEDDHIITIDPSLNNKTKLAGQKNTKRGVTLSTFLIPISMSQFFEVSSTASPDLVGTYKITSLGLSLNSRTGSWTTNLRGEPL